MFSITKRVTEAGSGKLVEATISEGILDRFYIDFEDWDLQDLELNDVTKLADDAQWNWCDLLRQAEQSGDHSVVAMNINERIEGIMILSSSMTSQLPDHSGEDLVYISRMSVSPWNRVSYSHRHFTGIGNALLESVVDLSHHLGCGGRVGVHATPNSVSFFRDRWRFEEFGLDLDHEDRIYLELAGPVTSSKSN